MNLNNAMSSFKSKIFFTKNLQLVGGTAVSTGLTTDQQDRSGMYLKLSEFPLTGLGGLPVLLFITDWNAV